MQLTIPKKELEKILADSNLKELFDDSSRQLNEGDLVVMSVGTYCGRHSNDDWRWIKGYVKKLVPSKRSLPEREEKIEENYNIIKVSPFRNKILRKLFPSLKVDLDQSLLGVCYGRILKY